MEKRRKIILYYTVVNMVLYFITMYYTSNSFLHSISGSLVVLAIMLFYNYATLSVILFTIAELCNIAAIKMRYNVTISEFVHPEIVILFFGTLIIIAVKIKNFKKPILKNFEQTPIKLKRLLRITMYSLLLITSAILITSMDLNDVDITMISSLWAITPLFTTIMLVFRTTDMYFMKMLNSIIVMLIMYMSATLGEFNVSGFILNLIIMVTLVISYSQLRFNKS